MLHIIRLVVFVTVIVSAGCLSPFLRKGPAADAPQPTLLTGMKVQFNADSSDGPNLFDVAQNAGLDEFSRSAATMVESTLSAHGFAMTTDGGRTMRLEAVQLAANSATAALTGGWRHPDASSWTPALMHSMFVQPAEMVGKIRGDAKDERFAFVSIDIQDTGLFMKEAQVVVRISVYGGDGKELLDLQGIGSGDSALFVANRSPGGLSVALERAFASVNAAPVQAI